MGVEKALAKLTAQTPSMEPGTGGIPELTGHDVAAALGFHYKHIPPDRIGVHLVLAKYTDDNISISTVEPMAARMAWLTWFDKNLPGNPSTKIVRKVAKAALEEFCQPGYTERKTATQLAALIGIDYRTLKKSYGILYEAVYNRFRDFEDPVLRALYFILAKNG